MSLILKRAQPNGNSSSNSASPVQRSSLVNLEIFNKSFMNTDAAGTANFVKGKFWFINLEPLTFSIDTSWKDGPGASIAGKVDDLMNSWIFKLFAGDKTFVSIATDSWSQKVAEKGSPISIKLKFRAFHESVKNEQAAASHSYLPFIYWFTRLCAPPNQYSLTNGVIAGAAGAFKKSKEIFEQAEDNSHENPEDKSSDISTVDLALQLIASVPENIGLDEPGYNGENAVRGQFTLRFKTEKFGCDALDWIVKSFSWTPSQQMIYTTRPEPLWVDFDVELETNICPSNAYVSKFLAGKNRT